MAIPIATGTNELVAAYTASGSPDVAPRVPITLVARSALSEMDSAANAHLSCKSLDRIGCPVPADDRRDDDRRDEDRRSHDGPERHRTEQRAQVGSAGDRVVDRRKQVQRSGLDQKPDEHDDEHREERATDPVPGGRVSAPGREDEREIQRERAGR